MADTIFLLASFGRPSISNPLLLALGQFTVYSPSEVLTDIPDWFPTDTSVGIDTPLTSGVKFWYPTKAGVSDSVELKSQHWPAPKDALNQIRHELTSGKVSIYNRTNSNRNYPVNLRGIPTEKRMRLYIFLRNIVVGSTKTFQFEDEGANLYTVRFWDDIIDMPMEYWLQHVIQVNLRKEVP